MNRDIKFRAWDKATKKFSDPAHIYIEATGDLKTWGDARLDPTRFILQQYTGLKDKNGVEIYEGDIIKVAHWSSTGNPCVNCGFSDPGEQNMPVEFDGGRFGLRSEQFDDLVEIEGKSDYEVIGNIYENPELTKGEQD